MSSASTQPKRELILGARKGQNNFDHHQRSRVETGEKILRRVLKALPRRTKYADFDALKRAAAYAAGVHPTTLARNPRYRKAIWDHIAANPGVILDTSSDLLAAATMKAQTVSAEIKLKNVEADNRRLRKILEHFKDPSAEKPPVLRNTTQNHDQSDFDQLATILLRLLTYLENKKLGIFLAPDKGEIVDAAEPESSRVVVGRPLTNAFVDWMSQQAKRRPTSLQV